MTPTRRVSTQSAYETKMIEKPGLWKLVSLFSSKILTYLSSSKKWTDITTLKFVESWYKVCWCTTLTNGKRLLSVAFFFTMMASKRSRTWDYIIESCWSHLVSDETFCSTFKKASTRRLSKEVSRKWSSSSQFRWDKKHFNFTYLLSISYVQFYLYSWRTRMVSGVNLQNFAANSKFFSFFITLFKRIRRSSFSFKISFATWLQLWLAHSTRGTPRISAVAKFVLYLSPIRKTTIESSCFW